jgi:ferredoxin
MARKRKATVQTKECVACGCCLKSCPLGAISVYRGLYALVDEGRCVGCGKCEAACPAQVIDIIASEGAAC